MEEKERFEIADFELGEPSVIFDNKAQQIILTLENYCYNEICKLVDLLNQKEKRIKKLEDMVIDKQNKLYSRLDDIKKLQEENQQLKERLSLKIDELHIAYCGIEEVKTKNGELKAEIKTLKQSQKQLAISELKKLREYIVLNDKYDEEEDCNIIETFNLLEGLADKIKSLKGEE